MGGILGRQVELIYEDDQGNTKTAMSALNKMIHTDKVPVIIGSAASSITLSLAPVAEECKTVLLTPMSSAAKISQAGDYIFRALSGDNMQGKAMAEFARRQGYKKVAIFYINNDWGMGLEKSFSNNFKDITFSQSYNEEVDVRAQLTQIKNSNAEAVFLPCYVGTCVQLIKQVRELDINIPILSADNFESQAILDGLGKAAEGIVFTTMADGSGDLWEEFAEKFKNRYLKEPNILYALSYDGLYSVKQAIEKVNSTDSTKIKNALYEMDFVGPSGRNKFDQNGDMDKPFGLKVVRDGKFVPYK